MLAWSERSSATELTLEGMKPEKEDRDSIVRGERVNDEVVKAGCIDTL